jgi:hypothetical protein
MNENIQIFDEQAPNPDFSSICQEEIQKNTLGLFKGKKKEDAPRILVSRKRNKNNHSIPLDPKQSPYDQRPNPLTRATVETQQKRRRWLGLIQQDIIAPNLKKSKESGHRKPDPESGIDVKQTPTASRLAKAFVSIEDRKYRSVLGKCNAYARKNQRNLQAQLERVNNQSGQI